MIALQEARATRLEYAIELLDAAAEALEAEGYEWAPREIDDIRDQIAQHADRIRKGN